MVKTDEVRKMETKQINQQSGYEQEKGLVSRKELKRNILGMFDELTDDQFHSFYNLLWNITAMKTLSKCYQSDSDEIRRYKRKYGHC